MSDAEQTKPVRPCRAEDTVLSLLMFLLFLHGAAYSAESMLAYIGSQGRLEYSFYANEGETNADNVLPDFSYCGYKGGGAAIPDVPVVLTLEPQEGDDTQSIQNAINTVSARTQNADGFRGAVLLKAGRYQVASTLYILASGVVLRGEGQDVLGTVLEAVTPSDYDVISVGSGSASYAAQSGTIRAITTPYVPSGAVSFEISDTSGFSVGDWISVRRTPNQFWIDDLDMAQWGWTPSGYITDHERYITAISGNTITVDVPLVDVYQDKYGGGQVFKLNPISRISLCAVENLRIESCYAGDTDEEHPWDAIKMQYVENSWIRGVTAQYFAYSCVNVSNYARWITVEDCAFLDPKSIITGGRRYSFNIEGTATRVLIQRCYAYDGRHDFVLGSRTRGPNAFVDCYAAHSNADSGPHHRWSTGTLFDNIYSSNSIAVENRQDSGTGHGWSGAQMVFWNCKTPNQKCDAPKGAMNFAIGSKADKCEGSWAPEEPFGWWEHQWQDVYPRSLYFQQLQDRLGPTAVNNVSSISQCTGNIWDEILAWAGNTRFQPNPLREGTPADRPLLEGLPVIFEAVPADGAVIREYQWYEISGSNYIRAGENSPLLILPEARAADFGRTFFCRVVTDKGPFWSPAVRITNIPGGTNGQLAEDFNGRTANVTIDNLPCNGVLGGIWDTEGESTGNVQTQIAGENTVLLVSGHSSGTLNRGGGISGLTNPIENTETGVLFFRFKANAGTKPLRSYLGIHHYAGSAFLTSPTCQGNAVTAGFGIVSDASSPVFDIITVDHAMTLQTGLLRGQWYNVWIEADNAADTFNIYVTPAEGPDMAVKPPAESDRITPQGGCTFGIAVQSPLTGAMFLVPRAPDDIPLDSMWIDDIYWNGDSGLTTQQSIIPAAPAHLTAVPGEGIIVLDWDDNTEPDFSHYVVYRSTKPDSGFTRLAEGVTESCYIDRDGMDGQTRYYYRVRAENSAGQLSVFSSEVSSISKIALEVPAGLRCSGMDGAVRLLWDANTQPGFAGFILYRSRCISEGYVPIASGLTVCEYLDQNVENNKTYYYVLTAFNDEGEQTAPCLPVEAVPHLPENLALYKPVTASSYYSSARPEYAVDGLVLNYPEIWYSAQDGSDQQPWIRVDLQETYLIDKIRIHHWPNPGTYSRNRDFDLDVLDDEGNLIWSNYDPATGQGELINAGNWMNSPAMIEYILPPFIRGRYIVLPKRSFLAGASASANISELEIFHRFMAPASPTNLSASANSGSIVLSWDMPAEPVDHYIIYRRNEQNEFVPIANAVGQNWFEDSSAEYGTAYFYVVAAADGQGIESGYSEECRICLPLSADFDSSGIVDFSDFIIFAQQWLSNGSSVPSADIAPHEGDGRVDIADLFMFARQWQIGLR